MARDYANRRSRNHDDSGRWRWPLAIILLILFAIGIFYLKQQSDKIAAEQGDDGSLIKRTFKGNDEQPVKPAASKKSNKKSVEKEPAPAKQQDTAPQPKFDFYTMLPKSQVASAPPKTITTPPPPPVPTPVTKVAKTNTVTTPAAAAPATNDKSSNTATTGNKAVVAADQEDLIAAEIQKLNAPKTTPQQTKSVATANYIVQVGVFKNHATADQFKAQLVMQGYEAKIKPTKKNLYRVWIGPYPTLAAAKDQQHSLEANHIKSRISKES